MHARIERSNVRHGVKAMKAHKWLASKPAQCVEVVAMFLEANQLEVAIRTEAALVLLRF